MEIKHLTYELEKCRACSCSRCYLNGTDGCYVDIAVRELNRYEQAMDSLSNREMECDSSG